MAYEIQSPFIFQWQYDASGYELKNGEIVASGGKVVQYLPDRDSPALHRDYLNLFISPVDEDSKGDALLLDFVNKYGLLGTGRQTKNDFWNLQRQLAVYVGFVHDDPAVKANELIAIFNRSAPTDMVVRMALEHGKTVLRVAPLSLISWMWLRFAQEKTASVTTKLCEEPSCGKWFEVGQGFGTRRKRFCSDNCRFTNNNQINAAKKRGQP